MSNFSYIQTHDADAKARLTEYLKDGENINKLVGIIMARVQELEDCIEDFRTKRNILTADGETLNGFGEYFDLTRNDGESDTDFRLRIQTAVSELFNAGQVEVLINAFKVLVVPDTVFLNQVFPATVEIYSEVPALPTATEQTAINTAMQRVRAGGVLLALGASVTGTGFVFSDQEDGSLSGQYVGRGFATTASETDGGEFPQLFQ